MEEATIANIESIIFSKYKKIWEDMKDMEEKLGKTIDKNGAKFFYESSDNRLAYLENFLLANFSKYTREDMNELFTDSNPHIRDDDFKKAQTICRRDFFLECL